VILLLLFSGSAICAEKTKAKSADSLLEKAEVARKTGDLPTAIRLYQQAMVAAPDKEDAYSGLWNALYHEETIRLKAEAKAANPDKAPDDFELNKRAMEAVNAKLIGIYRKLVAGHPHVTNYRYQLAMIEHQKDGKLTSTMEEIVASDPKFAPAVAFLGYRAAATGNKEKEREYLRRACELDPNNQRYVYDCLSTYKSGDQKEYLRRVDEFVAKYPKSEYSSTALQDAAENATTTEDRIAFLERAAKLPGSYSVDDLLELYSRTDIPKAANLAREKLKAAQASKDEPTLAQVPWVKKTADYWTGLAHAEELLKAGKLVEAKTAIDNAANPLTELRPDEYARAKLTVQVLSAQGKPQEAYKFLLDNRETIGDTDRQDLAIKLAPQIGKSEAQVKDDIVSAVLAKNKRPDDVEFEALKGDDKIKLSSLRGKYVLVNEWHPT
jgi:tetratricopeptide (TPR) repeat protein